MLVFATIWLQSPSKKTSSSPLRLPREESAAYIKDWLAEFRKEPTYLFDILTDVNRAARMISERLACEQEPETSDAIPAEAA